jgi:hypothetical protein
MRRTAISALAIFLLGVPQACSSQENAPGRRPPATSDEPSSPTLEHVGSAGVTVLLPSRWHTTVPDDGNVTDPVTRIVVASAPIRPEPRGCHVSDYDFPADAVALVVVEWLDPSVAGGTPPPRPGRFTRAELPLHAAPAIECFDGPGGSAQFVDRGRIFGAYVLLGPDAPDELADAARGVLDSLRVQPRP